MAGNSGGQDLLLSLDPCPFQSPSAQCERFGPGLVYRSNAFNACLPSKEGKGKELNLCIINL